MDIELKAKLKKHLQRFLDANADEIGEKHDIWQDETNLGRNALLMANAVENVIDSMALQNELEQNNKL